MKKILLGTLLLTKIALPSFSQKISGKSKKSVMTGTEFYRQAASMTWRQRDSFAIAQFRSGSYPSFLLKFLPVKTTLLDSSTGKTQLATIYVSPDYFSIGTEADWARVPLTPMAAQVIADSLNCILPTTGMVDAIYQQADVTLEPIPMYAFRDSTPTMWHHHLIIEGQRKGRKGLIAGIKKDIVTTPKLLDYPKRDRVAIYSWHKPDGKPIQPLYTGHVNWYVDYSHGFRLVSQRMKINGKWVIHDEVRKK